MAKMKKIRQNINGQIVEQLIENSKFKKNWDSWLSSINKDAGMQSGSLKDFLNSHIKNPREGSSDLNAEYDGAYEILDSIGGILSVSNIVNSAEIALLEGLHSFLEEQEGGRFDPANILFHDKVYRRGKVIERIPVYGHWKTKLFVKNNKKYGSAVKPSWYSSSENTAKPPPHLALYSTGSSTFSEPKGLMYILEDAIKELKTLPTIVTVRQVRNKGVLGEFPQVKQYLEGLMNGTYFKEGKIQGKAIVNALSTQTFEVNDEKQRKMVRDIAGLPEKKVVGKIVQFRVETTPAVVELIYRESKKRKAGGFYITGKTMDKRPRKDGQPIAKSWLNVLWRD